MVNVIQKKCNVTGKIIIGIGQKDFDKKWTEHLDTLNNNKQKTKIEKKEKPKIEKKEAPFEVSKKDLEKMTKDELNDFAVECDIEDIDMYMLKKDMIKKIWKAL